MTPRRGASAAEWDAWEDHHAAVAQGEEDQRQADYEHEMAIADYLDEEW